MLISQSSVVIWIFKLCGTIRLFPPFEGKFYLCPQEC